ncbi:MAG: thioesterase family protein [Burkholderiaceae bacterium]|nr:thioesterase family protein [Burkholderiaceae bacterium]
MSPFDDETRVTPLAPLPVGPGSVAAFAGQVHPAWNIGANPNGGYLLALAAQALRQRTPAQPDPLSITVHYLRPGLAGLPCRIETRLLRSGRTLSTVRATLVQQGDARLEVLAAMGDLGAPAAAPLLTLPPPEIPPPEACPTRSAPAQGIELPILERLDIRLHPDQARPGAAGQARVSGWIRFSDGRAPDALACLLMADAFPPAVFGLLGMVGWVPTIELTVHLRRRPAPGWLLGQFWSHDLSDGRVVEDGALWDASGQLVLQARQLALVRQG